MLRLKELRELKKFTQIEVAKKIGITQAAYSNYESGKREADYETLKKLSAIFNVSIDEILGQELISGNGMPPKGKGLWIPVLGCVQAGVPVEAVEDIIDYEEITLDMAAHGEYFGLKIRGSSMEPRIKEDDVVIVRKQETCENNDIAVVLVNGDCATVKKIKKTADGIMLIPNNLNFEPMFYSNEDIEKLPIRIIGKVVELRAKF